VKSCLLVAGLLLASPVVLAADQSTPARAVFATSCLQLATAMSLQGDAHKRFVDECVRSKESVHNKSAPTGPFEAQPAC
jgi:hypothetical protein